MTLSMIKSAPPLFNLGQPFTTLDGKMAKIEIRGIYPDLFFKADDISVEFGIPHLVDMIMSEDTGFQKNIHYQEFFVEIPVNKGGLKRNKKELFLTYIGLLVMLFVSRTPMTDYFQETSSKILSTCQFGSNDDKFKLVATLLSTSIETIKDVFSEIDSVTTPTIYILSLGTVKNLRNLLNIDIKYTDDMCVLSYGCSSNIYSTMAHYYNEYPTLIPELVSVSYIDPIHITDATRSFKSFMKKFEINSEKQLICVYNTWCNYEANKIIKNLHTTFGKRLIEITRKMDNLLKSNHQLENHIVKLQESHQLELQRLHDEMKLKQLIHDNELQLEKEKHRCKDILIKQLELEVQNWKYQGQIYEQECLLYEHNVDRSSIIS